MLRLLILTSRISWDIQMWCWNLNTATPSAWFTSLVYKIPSVSLTQGCYFPVFSTTSQTKELSYVDISISGLSHLTLLYFKKAHQTSHGKPNLSSEAHKELDSWLNRYVWQWWQDVIYSVLNCRFPSILWCPPLPS